jgi:hypothetical protein
MKSLSSFFRCLLVAVGLGTAGCFVPQLPQDVIFSCEEDADCADDNLVCAPWSGGGYCCLPRPEACNYVDDDCDGETDEGFDVGAECDV